MNFLDNLSADQKSKLISTLVGAGTGALSAGLVGATSNDENVNILKHVGAGAAIGGAAGLGYSHLGDGLGTMHSAAGDAVAASLAGGVGALALHKLLRKKKADQVLDEIKEEKTTSTKDRIINKTLRGTGLGLTALGAGSVLAGLGLVQSDKAAKLQKWYDRIMDTDFLQKATNKEVFDDYTDNGSEAINTRLFGLPAVAALTNARNVRSVFGKPAEDLLGKIEVGFPDHYTTFAQGPLSARVALMREFPIRLVKTDDFSKKNQMDVENYHKDLTKVLVGMRDLTGKKTQPAFGGLAIGDDYKKNEQRLILHQFEKKLQDPANKDIADAYQRIIDGNAKWIRGENGEGGPTRAYMNALIGPILTIRKKVLKYGAIAAGLGTATLAGLMIKKMIDARNKKKKIPQQRTKEEYIKAFEKGQIDAPTLAKALADRSN